MENSRLLVFGHHKARVPDILKAMRERRCEDPRDKIYGALGLLGSDLPASIIPSYDVRAVDLEKTVFLNHCRLAQRLDLLVHCDAGRAQKGPSWVPNWRSETRMRFNMRPGFQAAGFSEAVSREKISDILSVQGVKCGTIIGRISPNPAGIVSRLEETYQIMALRHSYPSGETPLEAWARAMTFDNTSKRFPSLPLESLDVTLKTLRSVLDCKGRDDCIPRHVLDQIEAASQATFIELDSGYIGFAVDNISHGDKIVVLLGCWTPMILRPENEGRYSVVGPCFVPGLMDSEALLGSLPFPWTVEQWHTPNGLSPRYRNALTGVISIDDPRLEPLTDGWERVEIPMRKSSPLFADSFRNRKNGEIQNSDPRMAADELLARGTRLQTFELV